MHPIGIDLGTTFSAITKWVNHVRFTGCEAYQIPAEGSDTLPSKVFVDKDEDKDEVYFIVGGTAQNKGMIYPDQYVNAVKRQIEESILTNPETPILGVTYSPIDISAEIIKHLLNQAEGVESPGSYIPEGLVVTVPYYFKHHQNSNTKQAAIKAINDLYSKRSGYKDSVFLGLVAEPIAAGLDYAFSHSGENLNDEKFIVFDLGGGTFDLTIFSLSQTSNSIKFEVLAIDGDDRLGGEDFDESLFLWMCDEEGIDISTLSEKERKRAVQKIMAEITKAKVDLSSTKKTSLIVGNAYNGEHIDVEIRRKDFEKCLSGENGLKIDFLTKIESKLDSVLQKSGLSSNDITSVLLTGGSSQIPIIHEIIENKFGKSKVKQMKSVRLAVARGAAIYSAYLLDKKLVEQGQARKHLDKWESIEITEPTAHNLGIPTSRSPFYIVLKENSITPASSTKIFNPSSISEDGKTAHLSSIKVLQGHKNSFSEIGEINIGYIYTHGRSKDDIPIRITFTATTTIVGIRIHVAKGNEDQTDLIIEEELSFETS